METKKTAVEWFALELEKHYINIDILNTVAYQQAMQMQKQQMIEFAKGFWYYGNGADAPPCYNEDVEKYYNKTHKKNTE